LYILDFDIHTSIIDKYVPVQVYHKEGSFTGYERLASAWNKMGERTVLGQGKGESTNLGGLNSLFLAKGSKHSFYITLVTSCSTCSDLRFTTGTRVDALFTQNQHLRLLEGIANRYLFGRLVDGGAARVFNGAVYYTVTDVTPNTSNTPNTPKNTRHSSSFNYISIYKMVVVLFTHACMVHCFRFFFINNVKGFG